MNLGQTNPIQTRGLWRRQGRTPRLSRWVGITVVTILVMGVLGGCANRSRLSRPLAEKLIAEALMKEPLAIRVPLRGSVSNVLRRRADWEAFLRWLSERGYELSVEEEIRFRDEMDPLAMVIGPPVDVRLSLPEELKALDLGPYEELGFAGLWFEEVGRLLRYGKRVKVTVTGIRFMENRTEAVAEYDYEWEVDEEAEKALERLTRDFAEINEKARQLIGTELVDRPKIPERLRGKAEMTFRLYDDGWRVAK